MVRQRIQNLSPRQDMEADEQYIVGKQHETSKLVGDLALAEGVVSKVADVADLRVLHDKLVHGDGSDPE